MFATSSDPTLQWVFQVNKFVLLLDLLLLLVVMWMRLTSLLRQSSEQRFLSVWRSLLLESLASPVPHLPRFQRRDWVNLLSLWNYLHESLRGGYKQNLNQVGRQFGIHRIAWRLLYSHNRHHQLLAITTLGNLQEPLSWTTLLRLASHSNPFVSLAAARSLILINAPAAMSHLVPLICSRPDWSVTKVAQLLQDAGSEVIAQPLADILPLVDSEKKLRLLRYLETKKIYQALPTVRQLAQHTTEDAVCSACIRFLGHLGEEEDLKILRQMTHHRSWYVRVQAAGALGKIGVLEDVARLTELLLDSEWWVRYRAAKSLASLPFVTIAQLEAIQASLSDPTTVAILGEVIELRRWSVPCHSMHSS